MARASAAEIGALDQPRGREFGLAVGMIAILTVLFLPLPPVLIDVGLAFSIALSVVILMVALWIQRPLEFSIFPTVLLIATLLRLALNIATTRLILSDGSQGEGAAGHVIEGFANFVMGGDFLIGMIVFIILITVNFLVITKGASRIAEVGARFSLDAMPGKQMAIDADLSAGLIDEREAVRRRRELEEESAFYGAMDGASKFVRGDAIAGLIITGVNAFGGLAIGVIRHDMPLSRAFDIYTKLSVGDGLVTQIPALIVSLAAGLLVSKGGTRVSAESAVVGQFSGHPRALTVSGTVMLGMSLAPGLPFVPFALLGVALTMLGYIIPRKIALKEEQAAEKVRQSKAEANAETESAHQLRDALRTPDVELCFGKQLSGVALNVNNELAQRVARMRRKFAVQYGFVLPDIRLSDNLAISPKVYQIKIHGTVAATGELRPGDVLVVIGDGPKPNVPGEEFREPAFGMKSMWVPETFAAHCKRDGYAPIDNISVVLTHLSEVLRNNLAQLLSYKDMRALVDRLEPEYRKLLEEISPSQISFSNLQAVLKLLLAERVSIRNLHLILEAIAEVSPFMRKTEMIVEHVRARMAPQICGDLTEGDVLKILRLGHKWESAFHQALRRDAKGDVIEFDFEPRAIEEFSNELTRSVQKLLDEGHQFVIVCGADVRPYARMVTERLFPTLPVLSHIEVARGIHVKSMGAVA